jgi:hypothetical protein
MFSVPLKMEPQTEPGRARWRPVLALWGSDRIRLFHCPSAWNAPYVLGQGIGSGSLATILIAGASIVVGGLTAAAWCDASAPPWPRAEPRLGYRNAEAAAALFRDRCPVSVDDPGELSNPASCVTPPLLPPGW